MADEKSGRSLSNFRDEFSQKNDKGIMSGLLEISQAIGPIENSIQIVDAPLQEAAVQRDNPKRKEETSDLSYLLTLYDKMIKVNDALEAIDNDS